MLENLGRMISKGICVNADAGAKLSVIKIVVSVIELKYPGIILL